MRVLFVTHAYPRSPGDAAGSFLLRLAQALAEHAVEVRVIAPAAPGLAASEVLGGIAVQRFRYAPRPWENLAYTGNMVSEVRGSVRGKLALAGFLLAGVHATRSARRAFAPDVIHAHWWFPGGLIASRALANTPLVTTLHGTDVRLAVASRRAQPFCRQVLDRSAAVTTVSTWLAEQVATFAPGISTRVEPMPAATDLFVPGGPRTTDSLLFVGRLNDQKGIGFLLDSLAIAPARVTLDVVGDGTQDAKASLTAKAESLGIGKRVRWHGAVPQPQLPAFYGRAAATIVPSSGEGLGLVAVEAQLCGTPVIAFASGGLLDVVQHDASGLLVPPGDHAAMAAAITSVVDAPALAERLGREGRRRALERFAPHAVAGRYAVIYREAMHG